MKVSIADALESITVDLWGQDYEALWVTKTTASTAAELWAEANTDDVEESMKKLAELMDLRLKAVSEKAPKPSKLVLDKWNADEVSRDHVVAVLQSIGGPT